MSNQAISRLAKRLRKNQDITYRAMVEKVSNLKAIEATPGLISEALDSVIELLNVIRQQANIVEAYQGKELESNEILVSVVQDLANIATVLGPDGQNIKILTHSDPTYIRGVLVESDEKAFIRAVNSMGEDERLLFEAKLAKAGIKI